MTTNDPGPPSAALPEGDWAATSEALRRVARAVGLGADDADDVAQGAIASGLARGVLSLPWLRRTARHRAIDALRRRRDGTRLDEDSSDASLDPSAIAARFDAQRSVMVAIEGLDGAYRDVLFLRYFEDLSPRAIAARLGVPEPTVKTRLTRAHRGLRERLVRRGDLDPNSERFAAFAALAGVRPHVLAAGAPFSPVVAPLAATLAMKVLLTLTVVGLAALCIWFVRTDRADDRGEVAKRAATDAGDAVHEADEGASLAAVDSDAERRTDGPSATGTRGDDRTTGVLSGELDVRVLWSDGTPAAGVGVIARVAQAGAWEPLSFRAETDVAGRARLERVRAGRVVVRSDRGDGRASVEVELEPGAVAGATLQLTRGVDVRGRVVDGDGRGVAGASLWLSTPTDGWTGGRLTARADEHGGFELRDVPPDQSLAACAAGFLPSALVDLDEHPDAESRRALTLHLVRGGATLTGRVLGADGAPVGDALVVVEVDNQYRIQRRDGTPKERWSNLVVTSDGEGRFEVSSIRAGEHDVWVRAPGHALWHDVWRFADGADVVRSIELVPAASLTGVVRGPSGDLLEGATVHALHAPPDTRLLTMGEVVSSDPFGHEIASTANDGRFALPCVSPGEVWLVALPSRDPRGLSASPLPLAVEARTLAAGEASIWDAQLGFGRRIVGRVETDAGQPVERVWVRAFAPGDVGRAVFSLDGSFEMTSLEDEIYSLEVRRDGESVPCASLDGIAPDSGEVRLVAEARPEAEPARATVRFVDEGVRLGPGAEPIVCLDLDGRGRRVLPEAVRDGDRWVFEVAVPGRYRALAFDGDRAIAVGEATDIPSGGDVDLGVLRSQPGATLALTLTGVEASRLHNTSVGLFWPERGLHDRAEIGGRSELELTSLEAGRVLVTISGRYVEHRIATERFEVTLEAGRVVRRTVELEAGGAVAHQVRLAEALETPLLCETVRAATGEVVFQRFASRDEPDVGAALVAVLPTGAYHVDVVDGEERRRVAEFTLGQDDLDDVQVVVVDLR